MVLITVVKNVLCQVFRKNLQKYFRFLKAFSKNLISDVMFSEEQFGKFLEKTFKNILDF